MALARLAEIIMLTYAINVLLASTATRIAAIIRSHAKVIPRLLDLHAVDTHAMGPPAEELVAPVPHPVTPAVKHVSSHAQTPATIHVRVSAALLAAILVQ